MILLASRDKTSHCMSRVVAAAALALLLALFLSVFDRPGDVFEPHISTRLFVNTLHSLHLLELHLTIIIIVLIEQF